MQRTYLFYDIETSGLSKCFDQVLQFAAIRTDLELNELERHSLLVKVNPDTIPSPQAVLTHKLTPDFLQRGITEYAAIQQIHQLLNEPGTISLGYNTLGFDDEFLRFSFYRNLLPPYTHQYANNCGRMDLYPITVMYYLFRPKVMQWAQINASNTFKLEYLNTANNFVAGQAHDAMTDVQITLALARALIKDREMWNYIIGYFDKKTDIERCTRNNQTTALMIDGKFGSDKCYQAPVLNIGMHKHYKNQSLWLALDTSQLMTTTLQTIPETTLVLRKRFAEPPILLPYSERFSQHLIPERKQLVTQSLDWLQQNPKVLQAIIAYHQEYKYPVIPNLDVDAALYQNGFLTDAEQSLCQDFHRATVIEKIQLVEKFTNINLRTQATRVLGRNFPQDLTPLLSTEFATYLQTINPVDSDTALLDYRSKQRLSPKAAVAEIAVLRLQADLTTEQRQLLDALEKAILESFRLS